MKSVQPKESSPQGFALVIVLCIVVLLVALAVGFMVRATSERSAASGYHASVLARQLADTVTSLVQGQINAASTQGSNVDWVSQPGMVRTFDTSGNLLKAYKLYSGSNMIAGSVNITEDVPPASWTTDTSLYVDLNAPIEVSGTKNFPILDPTLALSDTTSAPKGFVLNTPPGATTYQPAPMPVRWLYVLRDGTIVSPAGSGKNATVSGESASNPIVGRVAFWTDDDSCKVNINTASEGTFWDVPRATTNDEYKLGDYQPAQREFQRYPGHPAMTSLSVVLPTLTPDQIYSIVPRVVGGGSVQGTVTATNALTPDSDRLYASVDELVFNTSRNTSPSTNSGLTKSQLEEAKFFLTARSRAPETNLFNLPRIACWPIFKDMAADRITAFDRLISFCASTGTTGDLKPYYFQRENAASPTSDMTIARNVQLYSYLQYLTSNEVPGFGGNFLHKYDAGATGERDQILTEIFDYIRCTNLHDDLLGNNKQFTTYWPSNSTTANAIPTGHGWVAPIQYTPAGGVPTMGIGRTYTLSELAVAFICNADGNDSSLGSNDPVGNFVLSGTALNSNEKYIQTILLPEMFSPMLGYVMLCPNLTVKISGLQTLTINGTPLFPASVPEGVAKYDWIWPVFDASRWWGGNPSWRFSIYGKGAPPRGSLPGDPPGGKFVFDPANQGFREQYPFIGVPVKISTAGGTMSLGSATLKVEIYAGVSANPSSANLIQTVNLKIPAGTLPIPKLVDKQIKKTTAMDYQSQWSFTGTYSVVGTGTNTAKYPGRLYYLGKEVGGTGVIGSNSAPSAGSFLLKEYDVVRSVLPAHGDFRLIAASNTVPDTVFLPLSTYTDVSQNIAADLSSSFTGIDQGFVGGKYISGITYSSKVVPDIPATASGTNTPEGTGDYDNGISLAMDGPLINKPDEGAVFRIAGRHPYFDNSGEEYVGGQTFFSPNRQIPSPGMFGSLPTGVMAKVPWRTLLFRPQDSTTSSKPHFGATSPKDHLMMDLFWMPVVEPYAVSDRFSTAGKINMNYQILPFSYIERSTGMLAVLKSEMLTAFPNSKINSYKASSVLTDNYRLSIDTTETLSQFKAKFDAGDVFKSASEICDLHIVPQGQTVSSMKNFWDSNALTGDNTRERIYTTLYPRLTTRSNTYTVHFRVQSLKKVPGSLAGTWTEGRDVVTGEYRGSTTIERFIDANNSKIPDYAATPSSIPTLKTLDTFYKWRVVENRQFAP